MVEIKVKADCGNSPKNILLKDFNIAFADGNIDFIDEKASDDIVWIQVGEREIAGKQNVIDALKTMQTNHIRMLEIDTVSSHGKAGALNGTITLHNGSRFAFCDVYEFANTRGTHIKKLTSYVISI